MGAPAGYADVGSLDMPRAAGVAVPGWLTEGEANGGGDGMAVGPTGVGSGRG
jgi:hypothetical protein